MLFVKNQKMLEKIRKSKKKPLTILDNSSIMDRLTSRG